MSKRVIIAIICLVIFGAATVSAWMFLQPVSAPARPETSSAPDVKTAETSVMLTLPGASPIAARKENYDSPTSLWVVVSKDHPLTDASYAPVNLGRPPVATNDKKSEEEQDVRVVLFSDLSALFGGAKEAGYDLFIGSGYRSYALQKTYFDNYVRTSGEAEATKFSARPGQSEHQTGLSFDVSLASRDCYLETCFGDTTAAKWLAAHAYEYGFVLRYPADKTEITKYQYEPWHFRYVGKDFAKALYQSGLTLDEAYPYLQTALKELKEKKLVN